MKRTLVASLFAWVVMALSSVAMAAPQYAPHHVYHRPPVHHPVVHRRPPPRRNVHHPVYHH